MNYLSLFAGVGGFDIGAHRAGWHCAALVERDPDCQQILAHHYPNVPLYGDVRDYHGSLHPADVITGGFPCQDVSIAGQRAGLTDGTRSNLYREILRITKEMQHATAGRLPRLLVLENVANLLGIDEGHGFARVMDGLADCGAVAIEWALLDSQFYGVPQRRQRIFIVAVLDPRTECPDPLLPVRQGVRGDPAARPTQGQDIAGPLGAGSASSGWNDDLDRATFIPDDGTVGTLTATGIGVGGPDVQSAQAGHFIVHENQRAETRLLDIANSLTGGGKPGQGYPAVLEPYGFDSNASGHFNPTAPGVVPALKLGGNTGNPPAIAGQNAVRRLTPRECERLQGWPDDWTLHRADGKQAKDAVRYRQLGNGITANVAEWVCQRINMCTQTSTESDESAVSPPAGNDLSHDIRHNP